MKGLILAGGTGSRLWPVTIGTCKQLLPLYDKPLIHYPLATLMLAGVRDIAVITTPEDQQSFINLLGNGSSLGIRITYLVQEKPEGLAQAFLIAEDFIENQSSVLILGDNFFHGAGVGMQLQEFRDLIGAQIFAQRVVDPQNYGVVEFDEDDHVVSIEEKPDYPKSNFAIPGIYFYDQSVVEIAKRVKPSKRGELEITAINEEYLRRGQLKVKVLPRGTVWMDTGNFSALHDASSYIRAVQERQGVKISCLEEIAFRNGWISAKELKVSAKRFGKSEYGAYLELISSISV
jgi:glucose-1-phosphate thymidylyltransferase